MPKKFSLDLIIENLITCIKSNEKNGFLFNDGDYHSDWRATVEGAVWGFKGHGHG